MKSNVKLCLIIASCMSATVYCAEKKSNDTKNPTDRNSSKPKDLMEDAAKGWIQINKQIPEYIIEGLSADKAIAAKQYNQELQSKLEIQQRK